MNKFLWLSALLFVLGGAPAWAENEAALLRNILTDNPGKVAELLRQGASPDARDALGNPALGMAVTHKRLQSVRALLGAGADVDAGNSSGMTPLMIAASKGYASIAQELLNAGAKIDLPNPQSGATALFYAVQQNHADTVKLLLEHHADAALADHGGKTPAQWARDKGHAEISALLGAAGADSMAAQAATQEMPAPEAQVAPPPPFPLSDSPLFQPASLYEKLPLDTLAYIRIPSLWGFFSAPKDTALKQALDSAPHRQGVQAVEAGLYQHVLYQLGFHTHPALPLLLHHQRSPIEVAVLLPPNLPLTVSYGLISLKLDLASLEQAQQLLEQIVAASPDLQLLAPFSASGDAALALEPFKVFLRYEVDTRTLYLLAGLGPTPELLGKTLAQLAPVAEHPMQSLEDRIDPGHQGFFQWLNVQKILPLLTAGMPPEEAEQFQDWGLFEARAAAWGWGSRAGKGRLQLLVDAPRAGYRQLLPAASGELRLSSAGEPGLLLGLSLPLRELVRGVEAILQQASPDAYQEMQDGKAAFAAATGIDPEDAQGGFSGQIVFFTDQAGEFLALRLGDAALARRVLDGMVAKFGLVHETRESEGKTYHHLVVPNFEASAEAPADEAEAWFLSSLGKVGMHYYWLEDQGHWIFAQVPQALRDYSRHAARVDLQTWVRERQQQDNRAALLLLSTRFDKVPRYVYYTYLQALGMLADLAEVKLDLFDLPSAQEAGLPASGTYGLQVDLAENALGLEITFENNPLEFLLNPDLSNFAVAGILAAVAVPAYSDYLERAKVAEGLALLGGLKAPAEEFLAAQGRLPTPEEIGAKTEGLHTARVYLLEGGAGYAAEFRDIEGRLLLRYDARGRTWTCAHEGMDAASVPSACK